MRVHFKGGVKFSKILRGFAHEGRRGDLRDLNFFGWGYVKRGEVNISGRTLCFFRNMPILLK